MDYYEIQEAREKFKSTDKWVSMVFAIAMICLLIGMIYYG